MRPQHSILLFITIASLYSCFHSDKNTIHAPIEFHRLKMALDTNANFYLDSVRISKPHKFKVSNHRDFDSVLNTFAYVFDSVQTGNLDLTLSSFLGRVIIKKIDFHSDTTIFISRNELQNFENIDSKIAPTLELNDGDTIVIGLSSMGCFHSLKENIIINKSNGRYLLAFNTTRGRSYGYDPMNLHKEFDSSFQHTIQAFYNDCVKLLRKQAENDKKGLLAMSTTSTYIYIRKGNQVFRLPDIGPLDWDGYDKLIKAIDPPWPK